jgi:copper homeostasis protein
MIKNIFLKEACVETLQQAVMAQEKGANRIELCSHLEEGGLTPSKELITKVVKKVNIPVRVMIRPRAGNFIFSEEEIVQMKASIDLCKNAGVEGVVFGVLKGDHTLDLRVISELIAIANPLKIVIHKAIDDTVNPLHAVRELVKLGGVDTVLTSGGFATAAEGKETLKEMLEICWDHIELMPAGSITDKNLSEIDEFLGARAYHGRKIVGDLF